MALITILRDCDHDKYQLNYAHSHFHWPVNSPISNLVPAAVLVLSVTFFSEFLLSGYEPHCFPPRKKIKKNNNNNQTKKNQYRESEAKINSSYEDRLLDMTRLLRNFSPFISLLLN